MSKFDIVIDDDTIIELTQESPEIDYIYEEIERRALRETLEILMGKLSNREQGVLKARYGFEDDVEKTLEEIGQMFGITRERIRQIESKALRKLSHSTRIQKLKDFL